MQMTFDQYISNPMGIKNAVYSNREMYKELYRKKLDTVLVREVGKVEYKLYKDKNKFFVYMKIPSEIIPKFYYDTIIEFYTDKNELEYSRSLKDYYIKFYSNDPSFVYTFAHAMLSNDLFIRDLIPRMSKEAVKKVAKEKNPKNQVGYVKSIYFTYLLMKSYGLFNKIIFETGAIKYNKKNLLKEVEHADIKVANRQALGEEIRKEKSLEKGKNKVKKKSNKTQSSSDLVSYTKNHKKINNVKYNSGIKRSNNVKHIKKI